MAGITKMRLIDGGILQIARTDREAIDASSGW